MIILCTHHKGGVGKTEVAIQVTGVLRRHLARTLLIDCDSQASAWEFYVGSSPTEENEPRELSDNFAVVWNPRRVRIRSLVELKESYDHFVIDMDAPLQNTVQAVVQNDPDLVLIPINLQHEALTRLRDPLAIIASLTTKAGHSPLVKIIPLGAKVADIRSALDAIVEKPAHCEITPRVRNLQRETNLARKERRQIWEYPGCEDLAEYFQTLVQMKDM